MTNEEHEPSASSSSERGGKEGREEKRTEERKETSKEKPSKTEARVERGKEPLIPLREVRKLGKESGKAAKEVRELGKAAKEAKFALHELASKIKEGTIKTFDELSSSIEKWREEFGKTGNEITNKFKQVEDSFNKSEEYSKETAKLQEEAAGAVKKFIEESTIAVEGMRRTAEAAQAAGIMGPPGEGMRRYTNKENVTKKDGDEEWFEDQLRRLEEEDRSFADNWRRTWPLEQYLASIPSEERTLYRKLAEKFEDRRRLHDYQWVYKRASGVEAILNASSILPTGTIERMLKEEAKITKGPEKGLKVKAVEAMVQLQELAEGVMEGRRSKEVLIKDKGDTSLPEGEWVNEEKVKAENKKVKEGGNLATAESKEDYLKKYMLSFMNGKARIKIERDKDDKIVKVEEVEIDEERAAINRLGGRLFVVLGFAASYDIADFAGGDFFVARLMHLKSRFKFDAKEGKRWFGRDKLWENFPIETFGTNFSGGLLANLKELPDEEKDKFLEDFGLKLMTGRKGSYRENLKDSDNYQLDEEDESGRLYTVLKIVDPQKFVGLDLKEFGIIRENMLASDWADALFKADEARKAFLKPDQYLDRPTAESFFRLSATVEHLKDKDKWGFFAPLADGLIKFHKGPGILERITRLRFFEGLKTIDPVTGKERTKGLAWVGSDAERLGLDQDWRGGEMHRFINTIQRDNLIDRSRAEGLLRRSLDILGIPGIGPVRFTKEMWDVVGWGGLLAALFAPIYVFFAKLKEQLERS